MPGLLHHLDKYMDKMKKKVNHKIDKIGHNSKFDTTDFKKSDKDSYWDNNDKPKRKKSMAETLLFLLLTLSIVISIICFIMFLNVNIVFLIKVASPAFIAKMFPTDCNKPPYGTASNCMCPPCDGESGKESSFLGGASSCRPSSEFPYNHYDKANDGVKEQYVNWLLKSLAHTQMGLNTHITWLLSMLNRLDERILILLGLLILIILPLVFFYTFFIIIKNQIRGVFSLDNNIITKIVIILTSLIVLGADQFISLYNMMALGAKLTIYPWWAENGEKRPDIKNIWAKHLGLIKAIFGLAFVIAVIMVPFKNEYRALKWVILLWFLIPLLIHLFIYIKDILGGLWVERCYL